MLNPPYICMTARLALGDLTEIDRQLTDAGELNAHWLLLVKQSLISIANLTDLELTARQIYKTNPEVSVAFKTHSKKFEFAKYVRNIVVGHSNEKLLEKALEWKPEIHWLLFDESENATFLVNLFVLETAMNTFVDDNGKHLVLAGDSDLTYPPDWNRFLQWLTDIIRGGITFLVALLSATQPMLPTPPPKEGPEMIELFAKAGLTTFKRVTKSGG